jgi:prenyltransferase beta subunit
MEKFARNKYKELSEKLLAERNASGFWTGELSSSALSTAVAIVALKSGGLVSDKEKIKEGFDWICRNVNADGGFGDTPGSVSNVSTTLLCYAAVMFCRPDENGSDVIDSIRKWLGSRGIKTEPNSLTTSILNIYGKDRTFSIPIIAMLNLCGVIPVSALKKVPVLPFELTLLPAIFYRFVNLQVVSYALPALIGVGIYLHRKREKGLLRRGIYRNLFVKPAIEKLIGMVPASGGFLEAIPLTGFVAMCLLASGEKDNQIVSKGLGFLRDQQRSDGSWPIDSDLSTWVSTLSVKALGEDLGRLLPEDQVSVLRNHLLRLQYKKIHPFNQAEPGGWGWTNFSGSVPDADDTSGALLALLEMYNGTTAETEAVMKGCVWLTHLQNSDGGFPTFCRGWGRLPFDRSCADLTGHALLALVRTRKMLQSSVAPTIFDTIEKSIKKAIVYLEKNQTPEGAWLPLWFGNQQTADHTNPAYGTAKVCIYLGDCLAILPVDSDAGRRIKMLIKNSCNYLLSQQNDDGSWGGMKGIPGTVEETSLAVSALVHNNSEACEKGIHWLQAQEDLKASPIGLYFALLWYDEKLYPLIYYTEALRRYLRVTFNLSHFSSP